MNTQNHYLAYGSIYKLMLKFSIPCICALLVTSLYNIVDQIFIGQGIGYLANGATNVVFPIVTIATAFSLLVADGSAAYLSITQGIGNIKKSRQIIGNSVILVFIISFILVVIFAVLNEPLLWLLGGTKQNIAYAKAYFHIILFGFPFLMFTNVMSSIMRANGSPSFAMFATIIGCVINVILDPIAIFILDMGIVGAAIATVIGQLITAICSLYYLVNTLHLDKKDYILKMSIIKKSLPLGLSSFSLQICVIITTAVMNVTLVKYGAISQFGSDIPLTVVGIVMKVFYIVLALIVGLASGMQPVIGFNYGAKFYDRVEQVFKIVLLFEIIIGMIATIIMEFFPMSIIQLFGNESPLYNEFAIVAFRIYFSTIMLCAIQKAVGLFLQSVGKPLLSMTLSLLRDLIISLIAIIIASSIFGVYGVILSVPISDVLSFIVVILLYRHLLNLLVSKTEKKVQAKNECVLEGKL